MSFHSHWRVSAYLLLIHLSLSLILGQLFYGLDMSVLFRIILLPILLYDVSTMGFFAFKKVIPSRSRRHFFGGPSKVLGLLLWGVLLFGEFILTNRADPIWIYLILSVFIMLRFRSEEVEFFDREETFFSEGLFLIAFHFALVMAAHFPDIFSGEKSMDANFLGFYLRHQSEALGDPWFAGKAMGYYSFGYFLWAKVLQVFSLPLSSGYHVILATLFALCAQVLYAFFASLTKFRWVALVSALGTLLLPNLTTLGNAFKFKVTFTDFWEATRIYPGAYFAEFPLWSFAFGDLHPHVMNYPLLLTLVYLLFLFYSRPKHTFEYGEIMPLGLCWGGVVMTNFWDAPFVALMLSPLVVWLLVRDRLGLWHLFLSGGIAFLFMLMAQFQMGVGVAKRVFIAPLGGDSLWASASHSGWILSALFLLALLMKKRERLSLLFALSLIALFFLGHAFVLMDQINTIFKTQSFLFLVGGALMVRLLLCLRWQRSVAIALLLVGVVGTQFLLRGRALGVSSSYRGLKGDEFLRHHATGDYEIVKWLNQNVSGPELVLEYPGKSFEFGSVRISALTGLPLYLGWGQHVQLRGARVEEIRARTLEIKNFYENMDPVKAHAWARDQGIHYIVVGEREYIAYPAMRVAHFDQYEDLFKSVVKRGRTRLYKVL